MKKILTVTATLALALGLVACSGAADNGSGSAAGAGQGGGGPAGTITLTATNAGKGTVSWGVGESTNTAEFEGEWTQTVELGKEFDTVTFSVMGDFAADNNEVKCTITNSNGEVVDNATGSGKSAMASCSFAG